MRNVIRAGAAALALLLLPGAASAQYLCPATVRNPNPGPGQSARLELNVPLLAAYYTKGLEPGQEKLPRADKIAQNVRTNEAGEKIMEERFSLYCVYGSQQVGLISATVYWWPGDTAGWHHSFTCRSTPYSLGQITHATKMIYAQRRMDLGRDTPAVRVADELARKMFNTALNYKYPPLDCP